MSTSTKISSACTRACKSMPNSFGNGFLCENWKHSPLELGAHSVNHPMPSQIPAQPGLVLFAAEPTKDVHHSAFGRFFEGAQGDVLSLGQQGFGFSHVLYLSH
jgi:hypothetical protein